jgi:hypothetical protein
MQFTLYFSMVISQGIFHYVKYAIYNICSKFYNITCDVQLTDRKFSLLINNSEEVYEIRKNT